MSTSRPATLLEAFKQHLMVTERKPRTVEAYVEALTQFYHFTNGKPVFCRFSPGPRVYSFTRGPGPTLKTL